jgi:hypothetical protein
MFAWVFVELITIQAIGVSGNRANSRHSTVSTVTVPRRAPYSLIGMASSAGRRFARLRAAVAALMPSPADVGGTAGTPRRWRR